MKQIAKDNLTKNKNIRGRKAAYLELDLSKNSSGYLRLYCCLHRNLEPTSPKPNTWAIKPHYTRWGKRNPVLWLKIIIFEAAEPEEKGKRWSYVISHFILNIYKAKAYNVKGSAFPMSQMTNYRVYRKRKKEGNLIPIL